MTISTTIIKNSYSGNGSTTAFTYNFKITAATEIQVIVKTNATGAESVRSIGSGSTNYAVAGVGNNSGTVTFVTAPTAAETVVLRRSTSQTQEMDLIDNDPMSADTIETAHDKSIAITQELQEQIDRSLKISRANTMTSTEFVTSAADRASKVLAFDSSGELSVTQELGTFKGSDATVTTAAYVQRDIIKSTTAGQLNNVYICVADSVVGDSLTDTDHFALLLDAKAAADSATAAASSATASANSATASASSASTASGHKDTATTKASEAASSATAAASSASTSSTQATNSANSATASANSATASANSATAAANSASQAAASANFEVVSDTTPQLGGNLDTNEKEIVTVSNRDLVLAANGTGAVEIKGNTNSGKVLFNCENNSHHVSLQAPAHSAFSGDIALTLPTSVGSNGQALITNGSGALSFATITETKPTVADVSQTIAPATATAINITGTNFVAIPIVEFINPSTGVQTKANTVSVTNATTLAVNATLASGSYYVRIENPNGLAGRSTNNIITASTAPSFSTGAGSIGTFAGNFSGTLFTISGSSDSTVAFSETTSVLSGAGVTLNTATGALTTSDFGASSTVATTYTFTLRLTDAEGQTTDREFSMTSSFGATGGGQFN
jgi:hypothetical protein